MNALDELDQESADDLIARFAHVSLDRPCPTSERPSARRPHHRWLTAAAAIAIVSAGTAPVILNRDRGSGSPTVAMVQLPAIADPNNDCGAVTNRPPSTAELSRVAWTPATLPDGYALARAPEATVQERAAVTVDCWTADVTYLDPGTGRLLTASVSRQGTDPQPDCQLPVGYLPAQCLDVGGRSGALTHEGTRATIGWVTVNGEYASVSGYGLATAELLDAANTLALDGTNLSIQPPTGMEQFHAQPRTRSDDRDVTYFTATYTNGDSAADVTLTITTWEQVSVNEVGPAETVQLGDGTNAIAVTIGGAGTGITGWTRSPGASDSVIDVVPFDAPAGAYVTWAVNGLTFRVTGPDVATASRIAQQFHGA